jgi:hypothetical protein
MLLLRRTWLTLLVVLALSLPAAALPARSSERPHYDPQRAGHPLRIVAYVLHPVGVAVDYLVLRPAHWVGHREPFKTIFGHQDDY